MRPILLLILHELRTSVRDPHALAFILLPLWMYAGSLFLLNAAATVSAAEADTHIPAVIWEGPRPLADALAAQQVQVLAEGERTPTDAVRVRGQDHGGVWTYTLTFDSSLPGASQGVEALHDALDEVASAHLAELAGDDVARVRATKIRFKDTSDATVDPRLVHIRWTLIFFVALLGGIAGSLYPAIDVVVGERDRGTIETTLLAPVSRTTILLAKLLSVAVTVGTLCAAHGLCAWVISQPLMHAIDMTQVDTPWPSVVSWLLALPGLTAALLAATSLLMLAAVFAKDFATAEGSTSAAYLLICFATTPAFLSLLDEADPSLLQQATPFYSMMLLANQLVDDHISVELAGLTTASHLAVFLSCVALAGWHMRRTSFLFGAADRTAKEALDAT